MNGLARLVASGVVGAAVALAIPRAAILATTQELIAFLSLLMAGLLPAMILTATILRGDSFSAKRVDEYGGALRLQLRFWAMLFMAAGVSTAGLVLAKLFAGADAAFVVRFRRVGFDNGDVAALGLSLAGAGLGVVIQRLRPAYEGLVSLLDLNVAMARAQALQQDRSIADALHEDARAAKPPAAYAKIFAQDGGAKPE